MTSLARLCAVCLTKPATTKWLRWHACEGCAASCRKLNAAERLRRGTVSVFLRAQERFDELPSIPRRVVSEFPACGRTTAPEPGKDVVTHFKQTAHAGRKRGDW